VYETQFSADGTRVLTSGEDGTVRLWGAATGTNTLVLQVIAEATSGDRASGSLSRDGTRVLTLARPETLAVGHWESPVEPKLYDAATGDLLAVISDRFVVSAALSPDHARIATAGFNTAAGIWDARTGRLQFPLAGHEQRVASAEFSANGDWVATGSSDGTARVWDARTGRNMAVLRTGQGERVDFAGFSPDGTRVTTLCDDGRYLSLWDWRSRSGVPVATLTGHTGAIRDFAVSADGAWLVTASTDQTARIWDTTTGKCLRILSGHEGFVNGVAISPNARWVITAGSDTTARVWDAATGENWMQLGWNHVPRTGVAFSPDGKRIITGTVEGGVPLYTYDILGTVAELRTLAQARVQRRLTAEERQKYGPDAPAE
jgi:WD40 repeat protein